MKERDSVFPRLRRQAPGILIIAFWLIMMGMLFYREIISVNRMSSYQPFLSKDVLLSDQWMGIYFQDTFTGFTHTSIEPYFFQNGVTGYRLYANTVMSVNLLGRPTKVYFSGSGCIDEDYQLRQFNFTLHSGTYHLKMNGTVEGDWIVATIETPSGSTDRRIQIPAGRGVVLASLLSPFHSFGQLKEGERYTVAVFNPFSLAVENIDIEVSGRQELEWEGKTINTFVVQSEFHGARQTAWVSPDGEILKEQTGMGWTLKREPAGQAGRIYELLDKKPVDLTDMVSIPLNTSFNPETVRRLRIRLSGILPKEVPETQRQYRYQSDPDKLTVTLDIQREHLSGILPMRVPITAETTYLKPETFIQSDAPQIVRQARQIIGNERDAWTAAKLLQEWVHSAIKKKPVISIPSAVDVLASREGDCNEHTVLFTALARSIGIPAKMRTGLAFLNGRLYYHAWPSVFVGVWVDMDPTFGQNIADAAHIALLEGDLTRQMDIVGLLGNISAEVIETQ